MDIKTIRKKINFINDLNFTDDEIIQNYFKINEIYENLNDCKKNKNNDCINEGNMHEIFFRLPNNKLMTKYIECDKFLKYKKNYLHLKNYIIKQFNDNIFISNISSENDICYLNSKKQFYSNQAEIVKELKKQLNKQKFSSLYLSGNFKKGKTYILGLFCNEIAKLNYKICFVNIQLLINEFANELDLQTKIAKRNQVYKNMMMCDFLILDEIGIEFFNQQFHIEFLLLILNYRLENNLIVYFVSNLDIEKLKLSYIKNSKNKIQIEKFINTIEALVNKNIFTIKD